jgi:hypothetical protein
MTIQAQHAVRGGHHNVHIMTDHQHRAPTGLTHGFDLTVEPRRPRLSKALGGFIEDQNVRRL